MRKSLLFPALMVAAWMAAFAAHAEVRIISGGVGETEEDMLEGLEGPYNVKLLLVSGKRGAFLSNVLVRVTDKEGTVVGRAVSDGPIMLIALPPGHYTVEGTIGEETITRKITAPKEGRREQYMRFKTADED